MKNISLLLAFLICCASINSRIASAQKIISADDGTATIVTPEGHRFTIDGGTLSKDGRNLFHGFQEFGLDANQIATFLSNPNIQNILSRINGGNPSIINGLIEVSGGNSNLFLMNPAGIIFGSNARLNVPADFTATTATKIGFTGGWFDAFSINDYQNLVGNPSQFKLSTSRSGTVINAGTLTVKEGQNLSLIGTKVINTGSIEAPGGNISVAAVPGTNLVRISQAGSILSLEVELPKDKNGNSLPVEVMDLPTLLTETPQDVKTGLDVTTQGEVKLGDSKIDNLPGTNVISGNLSVTSQDLGGKISVLGSHVNLVGANLDASGSYGGGVVLVGGDYQGKGTIPNAEDTFIDRDSKINTDALVDGNGGLSVVWSDRNTRNYSYISARGGKNSGNGGLVETSSGGFLDTKNAPDLSAPHGTGGTWLIDPHNVIIDDVDDNGYVVNTFGIDTNNRFTANEDSATINVSDIKDALTDGTKVVVSTGKTGSQDGNITLATDLDFDSIGSNKSLVLEAANDIYVEGNILDSKVGGDSLNLSLAADQDSNNTGRIEVIGQQLNSGGGNIALTGVANNQDGIKIRSGSQLNSSGGDITLTGTTNTNDYGDNHGIEIAGSQLNSGGGKISLTGVANNNNSSDYDNNGIDISEKSQLNSGGGNITLTGTVNINNGSGDNDGIEISGESQLNSIGGNITLTGTGGKDGIYIGKSILNAGDGNISLTADELDIDENITIVGTGNFLIQPETADQDMTIRSSSTDSDAFLTIISPENLDSFDFRTTFQSITIGRENSSGTITIANPLSFKDPVTFRSPNGKIEVNQRITGEDNASVNVLASEININTNPLTEVSGGGISAGNNNITLTADTINLAENSSIVGTGNLTLQPKTIDRDITIAEDKANTLSLTSQELATLNNGFQNISIGRDNSSGKITVANPVTFRDPVTFRSPGGEIQVDGKVTGEDNAGITLIGSGNTTTLNADIVTAGNPIEIDDSVILGQSVTLDTTAKNQTGASIVIDGTINGTTGDENLNLNAGQSFIQLIDSIGKETPIANLTVNAKDILFFGGSIDTQGSQIYNGTLISLEQDATLTTDTTFKARSIFTEGNDLSVKATEINTGAINTNSGNLTLKAEKDIQVDSIDTRGTVYNEDGMYEGVGINGGNVDITTQGFFRSIDTIKDTENTSINTDSGEDGGDITIRHGGKGFTPFIVGNAQENGTAGIITSGDYMIDSGSFLYTEIRGNIGIISVDIPFSETDFYSPKPNFPEPKISSPIQVASIEQARQVLERIELETAKKPAIIYVNFTPAGISLPEDFARREASATEDYQTYLKLPEKQTEPTLSISPNADDELDLLLITPKGESIRIQVPEATREKVLKTAEQFYLDVSDKELIGNNDYLPVAQQLYRWLIAPLEKTLTERKVDNLLFVMPGHLRLIPVAALHDGKQFLAQKYSTGMTPSLNLTDTRYRDPRDLKLLAMGASKFDDPNALGPLAAVELELPTIEKIWRGKYLIDQDFTLENLENSRRSNPFGILHLATHADFVPGDLSSSYIQLYNERIGIDKLRSLGLNNPSVDLLVLSACRTAFGSEEVELGFAGLAVKSGVKSALASFWYVGDTGTLGLMAQFYSQLKTSPIKAEALQKAQVEMIEGKVKIEDGQLIIPGTKIDLPKQLATSEVDLSHPFYWAAFSLIGSPW